MKKKHFHLVGYVGTSAEGLAANERFDYWLMISKCIISLIIGLLCLLATRIIFWTLVRYGLWIDPDSYNPMVLVFVNPMALILVLYGGLRLCTIPMYDVFFRSIMVHIHNPKALQAFAEKDYGTMNTYIIGEKIATGGQFFVRLKYIFWCCISVFVISFLLNEVLWAVFEFGTQLNLGFTDSPGVNKNIIRIKNGLSRISIFVFLDAINAVVLFLNETRKLFFSYLRGRRIEKWNQEHAKK